MLKTLFKRLRMFVLTTFRYRFLRIGKDFYCGRGLILRPKSVEVGNHVFIGNRCHLTVSQLVIEDYAMLASNVSIVGGDHDFSKVGTATIFAGRAERKKVVIEKDAWIGHGAIILHGTRVGEGSIVAAGSVVVRDVPPYTVVAGNPAKTIRDRFACVQDNLRHSQSIRGEYHKQYPDK